MNKKFSIALVALVLLVLLIAAAFVPPVRAFAGQILKHISLGDFSSAEQIEDQPYDQSVTSTLPTNIWIIHTDTGPEIGILPDGASPTIRTYFTLEEAQKQLNFTLLTPKYLPEGYALREVDLPPQSAEDKAYLFYSGPGKDFFVAVNPTGVQSENISGTPSANGDISVYKSVIENELATTGSLVETSVNGHTAAWASGNILVWTAKGLFFEIRGSDLSMDEAIRIAESIG